MIDLQNRSLPFSLLYMCNVKMCKKFEETRKTFNTFQHFKNIHLFSILQYYFKCYEAQLVEQVSSYIMSMSKKLNLKLFPKRVSKRKKCNILTTMFEHLIFIYVSF